MPLETADSGRITDMLVYSRLAATYVKGVSEEQYLENQQLRLSVERCIELVGEAASKVSESVRSACPDVPWRRIVGQRNVLAHGYGIIDDVANWELASRQLPQLIPQLEKLLSDEP